MRGHDVIHEVEKFPPSPSCIVADLHLASGDFQSGE
jgi:hypothetical protein